VALVLAVDEMTALLHRVLNRFGALARARDDGEMARPFDRRRNGAVASEGACALVLESAEHCRRRGGQPLARLRAQVAAFDPSAPSAGWGSRCEELASQLRQGLLRQGIPVDSIDRVISGACGHREGDRAEARVLRSLWGETSLPPVLVPKATVGEYAGGFLASAVLAATGAPFAATPGFRRVDADLGVVPYDGAPLAPPRRILVSTLAVGGSAAWLVLEP
jgi:3-oxoacyl-[acyl-carrier-protein] synthase II